MIEAAKCEICLDHYRPDFPDIPLAGSETLNTAHCQHCHSRAARSHRYQATGPSRPFTCQICGEDCAADARTGGPN